MSANFDGIQVLTGNSGTLTGENAASTWTLGVTQAYSDGSNSLTISGFANLQGNANTDLFNVTNANAVSLLGGAGIDTFDVGATLTGSIDGEVGADVLQGSAIDAVGLTSSDTDGYLGTETDVSANFD
ncbi:hypothetical protein, partial [Herbaspirillum sp.]|uniref:hypothetical protein n=1 Tax=Herbaspirillum sp. TaxID=1890675 RepID=UPI002582DE4F